MEGELRPEYDLKSMRVRKLGAGRCGFARMDGQDDQFESSENTEKLWL